MKIPSTRKRMPGALAAKDSRFPAPLIDTVGVAEDPALGSQVSAVQAGPPDVPPDAGRYPGVYDTGLAPDHWPPVVTFTTD